LIDRLTKCPSRDGQSFLIVETRSGTYLHEGVPAAVASAFASARSPGQYYDQHIRGAYRFRLAGDLPADYRETVCVR
jgi:hypothetical protein